MSNQDLTKQFEEDSPQQVNEIENVRSLSEYVLRLQSLEDEVKIIEENLKKKKEAAAAKGVPAELTLAEQIALAKKAKGKTSKGEIFLSDELVVDLGKNDWGGPGAGFCFQNQQNGTTVAEFTRNNEAIIIMGTDIRGATNVFPNKLNGVGFEYQLQGDILPSTSICNV